VRIVYIDGVKEMKDPLWDKDSYHVIISLSSLAMLIISCFSK